MPNSSDEQLNEEEDTLDLADNDNDNDAGTDSGEKGREKESTRRGSMRKVKARATAEV